MHIAILDDDPLELELLSRALNSYVSPDGTAPIFSRFSEGSEMLRRLKRETFDLVILDWQLSEISGLQVLLWINKHVVPPPPVIMLTSRTSERDVVQALNAGAVEYVSKPFRQAEFLARMNNVVRRFLQNSGGSDSLLEFGNIQFYVKEEVVSVNGERVPLTQREFKLALLFFRNQGRPLSRSYLYEHLWSRSEDLCSRTLDTHIYRIRNKLKLTSEFGWVLSTVYGYGYRLDALDDLKLVQEE